MASGVNPAVLAATDAGTKTRVRAPPVRLRRIGRDTG